MCNDRVNAEGYPDPTCYAALSKVMGEAKTAFRPLVYICSPYRMRAVRHGRRGRLSSRCKESRRRSGECRPSSTLHLPDVLFKLTARAHKLMAAAAAAQLEVRARAQHLPLLTAAGVGFFHCEDIADLNVHYFLISSQ